jgi:hypothetical protein
MPISILRMLRLVLAATLLLLAAAGLGRSETSAGNGQAARPLFAGTGGGGELPLVAQANRARAVIVHQDLLAPRGQGRPEHAGQGSVTLNLFDDVQPVARRSRIDVRGPSDFTWHGELAGDTGSAMIVVRGDTVAGTVEYDGRLFQVRPTHEGGQAVVEIDRAAMPPDGEPIPVAGATGAGGGTVDGAVDGRARLDGFGAGPAETDDVLAQDDGSLIDMLVVYTPAARSAEGGVAAMEALIQLAIDETNQAYANSQMAPRVRLVHTAESAYTESGNMSTDLTRLRSTSDGYMDEVHGLRDTYKADQVTLIGASSQYCGIAYVMTSVGSGFASSAFSVVSRVCATGYYSFGHELGHNQGSTHDRANGGSAAYPYSYGWQNPTGLFRTVMAYNCPGGCSRVQHFSNPDVLYSGQPTGVDYDSSPATAADNARSIDNTAFTVANFRESNTAPPTPPAAPTSLGATAVSASQIDLSWTDNASDEAGFRVERSADGASAWATIANLGANATSFADSGLGAEETWYYRVFASNAAGDSGASNVANATTDPAPAFVDDVSNGQILGAGTVSGGFANTWTDNGSVQTITERESGGKKNDRYSYLEHTWTLPVSGGPIVTLFANAWAEASSDGDSFELQWSTNNSSWQTAATIAATSDGTTYSAALPGGTNGTLYVRVIDTDRTAGNRSLDTVTVDHLYVRSDGGGPQTPPTAASNLTATAVSASQIDLSWTDGSSDEYGFRIERSLDGSAWSEVDSASANATSYSDNGVAAETTYFYRVFAYNGGGDASASNTASATTPVAPPPPAISLSANGYKDRGVHVVDLDWSGASGAVEVRRDGAVVATTSASSYTDNTGNKGGRTYSYQVCESGTSNCSNVVNVTF